MTKLYDLLTEAVAANASPFSGITGGGQVLVSTADGTTTAIGADPIIELAGILAAADYDSNPEIWVERVDPGSVIVATPGPRFHVSNIIDGLCWVPGCDRVHLPDLVVCSQDLDAEVGPPDAPKDRAARIAQWREYVELQLNLAQQEVAALDEFDAR